MEEPGSSNPGSETKTTRKRPAAAKTPKEKRSKAGSEMSEVVKDLDKKELIPHTFAGRARPSDGPALEKYARMAAIFEQKILPKLEGRTKHKSQAGHLKTFKNKNVFKLQPSWFCFWLWFQKVLIVMRCYEGLIGDTF